MAEASALLAVITTLITAITALLAVVLVQGRKAKAEAAHTRAETLQILDGLQRDAAHTREQVTNSHASNLRDDVDDIARVLATVAEQLRRLDASARNTAADVRGLRRDVGRLSDVDIRDREAADRAHVLIHRRIDDLTD